MKLEIDVSNNVSVFRVGSDITLDNFGSTLADIRKNVQSASSGKFLINLSKCKNIDSVGLGTIVSIHKEVVKRNGSFGVVVRDEASRMVFTMTGLNRLFPVFLGEDEAVKSV